MVNIVLLLYKLLGFKKRIAEIYEERKDYIRAADYWKKAGNIYKAATLYEKANRYKFAAEL